jgi:hypothetical protein
MLQEIITPFFIPPELILQLMVSITLGLLLGIGIALIYKYTHKGMNYERSFLTTLVLIVPIVTMVMFFIQGDLVLSLGLVGSMSIIRFRTPIKDTRDMVFLFWSIAVGLGAGTNNWTLSIVATIMIGIVMSILYLVKYGSPLHAEFVLVTTGERRFSTKEVEAVINRYATNAQIRSQDVDGDFKEIIYELKFSKLEGNPSEAILEEVQNIEGVHKVSLLAPQLALPM